MRVLVAAGVAAGLATHAAAQQRPLPINRPGSAFPRINIGGVKSQAPRAIGAIQGSLLPPPPPPAPSARPNPRSGQPGVIIQGQRDPNRSGQRIGGAPRPNTGTTPDRTANPRGIRDFSGRNTPGPGLTIDGRFSDDRFRLGFHIGSGLSPLLHQRRAFYSYPYGYYPYGSVIGGYGYSGYGYGNSWYDDYDAPPSSVGGYSYPNTYVSPAPATPPAPAPALTTLEKADLALSESRAKDAVTLYQDYLKTTPNDAEATRSLALALLLDKRHKEAVAVMIDAYVKHPGLAAQLIGSDNLPMGEAGLRKLLLAVVPYAHRTKTASGYLTTAVLLQAQGKKDAALRLLAKAKDAGLDKRVASELEIALKP